MWLRILSIAAVCLFAAPVRAQEPIIIANVVELSGGGASNGVNWKMALELATDEINGRGGILGRKIELKHFDTQTNPGQSRAMVQKALDEQPYVIMGPIYSGSVKANMILAQQAGVPQFVGAQATELTQMGNGFLFRANISQSIGMQKIADYIASIGGKSIAIVWVNNDFGKGGREALKKEMDRRGINLAADLPIEFGQLDYSADVIKAKNSGADVIFPYMTAEDTARFVRELAKQGVKVPMIGETTLLQQNVIDLVGPALNGARSHLSLTADAPDERIAAFRKRFQERFKQVPDHNALSSYMALYAVKAATEKVGKVDPKALADAMHGGSVTVQQEPNVLLDSRWDANGDVFRASFLAEAVDGQIKIIKSLP
jgi:branched-chain amino acid transport system substrate-binding protein